MAKGQNPKSEAQDGIAKHIHNSWPPRMRNAMKIIIDAGGDEFKLLCLEAMRDYFMGTKSDGLQVIVTAAPAFDLTG